MSAPDRLGRRLGRTHRSLRLSVTDRCNLRCRYCMPAEGMKWLPREELLTYDELIAWSACSPRSGSRASASPAASRWCAPDLPALVGRSRGTGESARSR